MTALLELDAVSLTASGARILADIRLTLEAGEILALAGPSGSGKSTVLRIALGLVAPTRGCVRVRGAEASRDGRILVPPDARGLAVVFQDLALFPHLPVAGNVGFGLEARHVRRSERDSRVADALARVDLAGFEPRMPSSLSGGERQRVAIARALVLEPDVVLFDEPLASLDVALKAEMLDLLRETLASARIAALWVTHDAREARRLAERIVVLEAGRVVQAATLDVLAREPRTSFVRAFVSST
jgi:iron(III) transport system ATP-binding protein